MLVYAMSGGNPATIDRLLAKLHLDETDRALGTGILGYLHGDPLTARDALAPVDPLTQPPELGAFLALVKGSIAAAEDPTMAREDVRRGAAAEPGNAGRGGGAPALHRARLARPRTPRHFLFSCSQYVRRFLQSPYASQFADAFVAGVVALHKTIDLAAIDEIIAGMDPEQQKVIYLRLARRAAIDGIPDLAKYASAKAEAVKIEGVEPGDDPRALLYSSLASDHVGHSRPDLAKLKGIDRSRLSESDLQLAGCGGSDRRGSDRRAAAAPAELPRQPRRRARCRRRWSRHRDADAAPADDLPERRAAGDAVPHAVQPRRQSTAPARRRGNAGSPRPRRREPLRRLSQTCAGCCARPRRRSPRRTARPDTADRSMAPMRARNSKRSTSC